MRALLADIGGTNARFALLDAGQIGETRKLLVAEHATAEAAIAAALRELAPRGVDRAVLAVAGPVSEGQARLTNAGWAFDQAALAARFGMPFSLLNDFEALAHALPAFAAEHLLTLNPAPRQESAPMLVLGPGTGLGMAAFLPGPRLVVPTEGGHVGLAPADAWQDQVLAALRARCGRAGAEEALSGRGLANLHAVVAALRGADVPERDAAAITNAAETCPVAAEAVRLFLDLLAGFAGDMALAWGARGGVYLAGGILPRLATRLDAGAFRARFEVRPPMDAYMKAVPLHLVIDPLPAFIGLRAFIDP